MGSRNLSLSSVACTKFAPIKPVTTTTAAVRDELAPANGSESYFVVKLSAINKPKIAEHCLK